MKEMNRREFLTLSGAAVVALSLAGCGGGSYAPPAAPTGKEAELAAAINKVWKEKFGESKVDHEQLILNQDAVGIISAYGHIFETANETPHKLTDKDRDMLSDGTLEFAEKMQNYGNNGFAGMVCVTDEDAEGNAGLKHKYSCEDTDVRAFVEELLTNSNSSNAEFISIYCPVVQGKTYMVAAVFWNKTA